MAGLLILLGGLPGSGKTTIARALAKRIGAVHLRIDTVEPTLKTASVLKDDLGPAGYLVAYALAEDTLRLGATVIADAVNRVEIARAGWRAAAARTGARLVQVELHCSDPAQHRTRVEQRAPDIAGHRLPSWADVAALTWEPWAADLRVDTALPVEAAMDAIMARIAPR